MTPIIIKLLSDPLCPMDEGNTLCIDLQQCKPRYLTIHSHWNLSVHSDLYSSSGVHYTWPVAKNTVGDDSFDHIALFLFRLVSMVSHQ